MGKLVKNLSCPVLFILLASDSGYSLTYLLLLSFTLIYVYWMVYSPCILQLQSKIIIILIIVNHLILYTLFIAILRRMTLMTHMTLHPNRVSVCRGGAKVFWRWFQFCYLKPRLLSVVCLFVSWRFLNIEVDWHCLSHLFTTSTSTSTDTAEQSTSTAHIHPASHSIQATLFSFADNGCSRAIRELERVRLIETISYIKEVGDGC